MTLTTAVKGCGGGVSKEGGDDKTKNGNSADKNRLRNGCVLLKGGIRRIFIRGSVRNTDYQRRLERC
jgi:hypothetical protein